jgi:hypothetical protein
VNTFTRDLRLSAPTRRFSIYEIVPLSDAVLTLAGALLLKYRAGTPYALRSLDAIQLASAHLARSSLAATDQTGMTFVTVDRQLRGAAGAERFQTINPEHPPSP